MNEYKCNYEGLIGAITTEVYVTENLGGAALFYNNYVLCIIG